MIFCKEHFTFHFQTKGGVVFHDSAEGLNYDFRYGVTNGFKVSILPKSDMFVP